MGSDIAKSVAYWNAHVQSWIKNIKVGINTKLKCSKGLADEVSREVAEQEGMPAAVGAAVRAHLGREPREQQLAARGRLARQEAEAAPVRRRVEEDARGALPVAPAAPRLLVVLLG